MNIDHIILLQSFIFVLFLSTVLLFTLCIFLSKSIKKLNLEYKALSKHQESQIRALTSGAMGLGKKLMVLEERLQNLHSVQEALQESDLEFSFNQAKRMVEQGADTQSIADTSGLSSSEIQLMTLIHNQNQQKREPEPA